MEARRLIFGSWYSHASKIRIIFFTGILVIFHGDTIQNESQMPRLVKLDRSGKPRILESQGSKPVIVEYGYI